MNVTAMRNIHPVDELAEVREKIKHLQDREGDLKDIISKMMGNDDSLGGDGFIARQVLSERKGAIDEKAAKSAGIDLDQFRKPNVAVLSLRLERREVEVSI